MPLYARAGIAEVWIADLAGEAVERHTVATAEGYRRAERVGRGQELRSETLPDLVVAADAALG